MSNIGNLSFSVHLQDMTDADIAKIKQKLQNLSLSLNIDGNNIKVSNTDVIKKQIENAVKSVVLPSVKIDTSAVKQQIESSTQGVIPQIRVSLLKDNMASDIQAYLNTKSFDVKISVLKTGIAGALKNIGTVTVPVSLKVDKKIALDGLKKSLLNMSVPIGVRMKSSKDLVKDIQERMKNTSVKVGIDINKNVLRSNVTQALKGQTFKANLDLVVQKASVQQAIRSAFAQAGLKYNTTASDARQNLIDTRTMKASAYADAQKALADLRRAQLASSQAANQQGNSMQRVTEVAERQKGVFATLRENVANAYAVYRVGRFLNTAMRIGGEFQQQHIALQTIIGDADKANVLFERIKNLAVESPFKMLDLSKYTKQLAAFSIPYEELYDTLKRFGDISAGLGVDMGRIILAYGQVRSAEFLKGTELRQFTEAGIPLVTELAKKYTELRGTLVSVGDVYDMISKKQVPFSDVKDVLWDLTSEGGKFFNMQAALTDTLKGKLDKLADSYEIFLSEIANSNNDVLGGTLDLLADALKHWELIQDAVMSAVAAYGTYKATLLAVAAVQKTTLAVEGISKVIKSIQFLRNATFSAAAAQAVLNKVTAINPWVALASVLATVAGGLIMFSEKTEDASETMAKLNAEFEEEKANIEERERKGNKLISVIANENASIEKRKEAYNSLKGIYPTLFQNMTDEQAMMLKEIELRGKVSNAAREELREKLKLKLANTELKLKEAEDEVVKNQKQYNYAVSQGVFIEKWANKLEEAKDNADSYRTSIYQIQESLALLDKKEEQISENNRARWFKEAQDYVKSLPAEYKGLMPEESEEREAYFERIGKTVSNLNGKIKELDKNSSAAQEILGGYTTERDYANNIYTKILGGLDEAQQKAIEDARKNREDQAKKDEKEREEAAKRLVQAYADALKAEIAKVGSQWNLFKDLLEATGNESVSMNLAFGGQISFKSQLEQLEKMIDDEIKKNNLGISVPDLLNMSEGDIASKINSGSWGEDMVKNLTSLTDAYKTENEKVKEESIRNFIEIVKNSNDFAKQIENIERKLQKDLNDLRANAVKGGLSKTDLERREAELTARAEEEKSKVRFEEFKKSSDWVKVFDDLDRVSDATLDNMIFKIEEFAKQAHLSEEVTKQLVEAVRKLKDEKIERNPFSVFSANISNELSMAKKAIDGYKKAIKTAKEEGNTELVLKLEEKKANQEDKVRDIYENYDVAMNEALKKISDFASSVSEVSSLLEQFGNTSLKNFSEYLNGISGGMQSGYNAGSLFGATGGVIGGFIGAATGAMSGLVEAGRKAVDAEQERSQIVIDRLDKVASILKDRIANSLTGLYNSTLDATSRLEMQQQKEKYDTAEKYFKDKGITIKPDSSYIASINSPTFSWDKEEYLLYSQKAHDAINKALEEDNEYMAMYASMLIQRDEMMSQMATYTDKDSDKVEQYKRDKKIEIEKLDMEIEQLSKDMLSSLYSVDFNDWSKQITDSIVGAWSKGEDAAKAYENTVSSIMRNVAANMIQQKIIGDYLEKNIKPLVDEFIGKNGVMDEELFSTLTGIVEGVGEKTKDVQNFLDNLEKIMNEKGLTLKDMSESSSSGGLSKGIQSITEDTAGLLASYLNATRQDVSIQRTLVEQLVSVDVPKMSIIAQAQLQQLQQVAANTRRNADAADRIYELVNKVVDRGGNKLRI